MRETALIWDLDGTLLDSYGIIASSLQETLEEFQIQMPLEEIRRLAKEGSVSAVVALAAEQSGRPTQDIKAQYSAISGGRVLDIPAMDHGKEVLEQTAALGAVHFVYTHRGSTTEPVLEHLGLRPFFKEVVSSLSGFARKPSPDALLYLMERHHLNRDRVFYVGDRTVDMECARNAGVRGILYAPSEAGTADYVVRDLLEIPDLVRDVPGKERT